MMENDPVNYGIFAALHPNYKHPEVSEEERRRLYAAERLALMYKCSIAQAKDRLVAASGSDRISKPCRWGNAIAYMTRLALGSIELIAERQRSESACLWRRQEI